MNVLLLFFVYFNNVPIDEYKKMQKDIDRDNSCSPDISLQPFIKSYRTRATANTIS